MSGVSSSSATRNAPPTIGTASSSLTLESATKPTITSGQFAAAMSAPRLRAAFSPGVCCTAKHSLYIVYPADEVVQTQIGAALTDERRVRVTRVFAGGCAVAALVVLAGAAFEAYRLGTTGAAAAARVQQDVRASFTEMTGDVEGIARGLAADATVSAAMAADAGTDEADRALFDAAATARKRHSEDLDLLAITMYDASGATRAWAGRASDLAPDRAKAPPSLFVTPSPIGLRLVYLQPIAAASSDRARLGSVAVEHVLTAAPPTGALQTTGEYQMPTARGPVSLRLHDTRGPAPALDGTTFVIATPDGTPLLDASVAPSVLAAERASLRRAVVATAIAVLALTVLLLVGPLLDARAIARSPVREWRLTLTIVAVFVAGIAHAVAGLQHFSVVERGRERQGVPAAARRRAGGRRRGDDRLGRRPPAAGAARVAPASRGPSAALHRDAAGVRRGPRRAAGPVRALDGTERRSRGGGSPPFLAAPLDASTTRDPRRHPAGACRGAVDLRRRPA